MPGDDSIRLAKAIVRAYQASGISSKTHGGRPYVLREDGWAGPLDPQKLEETYLEEIARIEQAARRLAVEGFDRADGRSPLAQDRELWVGCLLRESLTQMGLDEPALTLFEGVIRHLQYRGDLWP